MATPAPRSVPTHQKGRSAAIWSMGSRVPSSITNALVEAVFIASARACCTVGQDFDGLGDVPVGGGGADAEPGSELGVDVDMAAAQVCEDEQGPAALADAPPARPALAAAVPQTSGKEPQGGAGNVDAGGGNKHTKPLVEKFLLVENPPTRGFTCLSADLSHSTGRLETAHGTGPERASGGIQL